PLMRGGEHYEALEGSAIDWLVAEARARIGRHHAWRALADVTCHGHHYGVAVQCRFARSPEAEA
ncbi:MAG: hypothetical protein QG597_1503, partial [Actinomycetota bacterium]|nr:hypothetical protein [Actinomycetota bacterium]